VAQVTAKQAPYYDALYRRTVEGQEKLGMAWTEERIAAIVPYITGSVLDLGCGLGLIADRIGDAEYLGVDFSEFAIAQCRADVHNPNARFEVADLRKWKPPKQFDTVLLVEVLEHVNNPAAIAALALRSAKRRIIATAPRDMPGRAHVWPTWMRRDLKNILGRLSTCYLFGGDNNDRWWLAIKEIK
jgi:SAM-dependent methyltransferase